MGIPRGSHRRANQRGARKRVRRGLGPSGMRGTIELLCRGGGGISAREDLTVVVVATKRQIFTRSRSRGVTARPTSECRKFVRSERRLERSGRRRIEREVWREAGEQYARVP